MLVLSRRLGQAIIVGGDVEIRILGLDRDGAVRLGIEAPRHITVHREEVQQRIEKQENVNE